MQTNLKPLTAHEVIRLPPVKATETPPREITSRLGTFFVSGPEDQAPRVEARIAREAGAGTYRIDAELSGQTFHERRLLPDIETRTLHREDFTVKPDPAQAVGHRPAFLDLLPVPGRFEGASTRRRRLLTSKGNVADTIFPPDNRYIFADTSYPWSCAGQVTTAAGTGTGVMIGPRHLLTVSHIVAWGPNNTAGGLRFAPSFFSGSTPFGVANATLIYSYRKNSPGNIDNFQIAEDYVVCVLDQPIGNLTGWMGSFPYQLFFNGIPAWSHIGYSADLGGGAQPSFQNGASFFFAEPPALIDPWDGLDLEHRASITNGDSGGPFFGWFPGEGFPRVVGVQSAQNSAFNLAGGGDPMVALILQARAAFP